MNVSECIKPEPEAKQVRTKNGMGEEGVVLRRMRSSSTIFMDLFSRFSTYMIIELWHK